MPKFTDELFARVPPHVVLSDLLLVQVKPKGETRLPCVWPWEHRRSDLHPSASANGEKGFYVCNGCGLRGDVVSLAVELGYASDVRAAIRWLRSKYGLTARARPPEGTLEPGSGSR
jgi:DNA primase